MNFNVKFRSSLVRAYSQNPTETSVYHIMVPIVCGPLHQLHEAPVQRHHDHFL
ncbi:hypothetical protein BDZ91DRAFT_734942, partial [Kalaharituber pfeilii]